jgi:hypothetical protein
LKVVNKVYKELGKQTIKVNKAIKTFEFQIDLRIYKQYLDKDDKYNQYEFSINDIKINFELFLKQKSNFW